MAETDRIICPYCNYEFTNSWEYFHEEFGRDGDFLCDGYSITVKFKRIDMTDEEFDTLPEN